MTRMKTDTTLHRRMKAEKEESCCAPEHVFQIFSHSYAKEDKLTHNTIREGRWTARTNTKAHKNPADVDLDTKKQLQKLIWIIRLISQQMSTSLVGGIITKGQLKISDSRQG